MRHPGWLPEYTSFLPEASLPQGIKMSDLQETQGFTMIDG